MNKDLIGSLAWAGGILALGLGASFVRQQGYIDGDAATRIVFCAIGLMVAWFGNRAPKAFVPSVRARQVTRVAGWSMAISGLVYAGMWAFAPIQTALIVGSGAVLLGLVATFSYCLWLRGQAQAA